MQAAQSRMPAKSENQPQRKRVRAEGRKRNETKVDCESSGSGCFFDLLDAIGLLSDVASSASSSVAGISGSDNGNGSAVAAGKSSGVGGTGVGGGVRRMLLAMVKRQS